MAPPVAAPRGPPSAAPMPAPAKPSNPPKIPAAETAPAVLAIPGKNAAARRTGDG